MRCKLKKIGIFSKTKITGELSLLPEIGNKMVICKDDGSLFFSSTVIAISSDGKTIHTRNSKYELTLY